VEPDHAQLGEGCGFSIPVSARGRHGQGLLQRDHRLGILGAHPVDGTAGVEDVHQVDRLAVDASQRQCGRAGRCRLIQRADLEGEQGRAGERPSLPEGNICGLITPLGERQHLAQPPAAFPGVAARRPEAPERSHQPQP
jgi:hypothetical protein